MSNFARISFNLLRAMGRLRWDGRKLRIYQDKRLREIVRYAYNNVFFYRNVFKTAKVFPSDIRSLDDIGKLPIIRKTDMRKRPDSELISQEFAIHDLKMLRTGGSTGEPFSIYISKKEDDWRKAIYMRANITCGQKPRDRWVAILDAERAADVSSIQHSMGIFAQNVVPVVWSRKTQMETVERLKPDILDGFSGALWLLAKEAEFRNVRCIRPRIIFGTGELISKSSRGYLEEQFGAPYYDQFGCTEIDRSAWQCSERAGYHMDVDSVLIQFVDDDGQEVGPGERGEIVYTSLFNHAMPLIRYGVQDVGIPINDICPCGVKLPLMKVVEGRSNSFLVFPGDRIVSPMSFIETMKAFCYIKEIDQYRVLQKREDLLEILIKKTNDAVDEQSLRDKLLTNIIEGLAKVESIDLSEVEFNIRFVDDLPLAGRGKLSVIASDVQAFKRNECKMIYKCPSNIGEMSDA
jgi:phenylacetate-CoA ligase